MGLSHDATPTDAVTLLSMALEVQEALAMGLVTALDLPPVRLRMRVGLHYGPVVDGLVGWIYPRCMSLFVSFRLHILSRHDI
jgi:class 3 adenylate cyclase